MFKEKEILRLFQLLNEELASLSIKGQVYLVGGAVMCLVFKARPSTKDVDGFFEPTSKIRQAVARVALKAGVDENWLNDGVKGFLSNKGTFDPYLELGNLSVFVARADYLLAMKCLAMRLGEEFHDLEDVRYLIRNLNLVTYDQVLEVITRYYPLEQTPQKTLYALEDLVDGKNEQLKK
ncbi:MAG: hypothetical protein ACD_73C00644G0002 [uncultured bacterium]|nr:MAG: hypothetical protein ACD_73C00644G0002 [uncultured bacterium]